MRDRLRGEIKDYGGHRKALDPKGCLLDFSLKCPKALSTYIKLVFSFYWSEDCGQDQVRRDTRRLVTPQENVHFTVCEPTALFPYVPF